jgi:hypothetical protein
MSKAKKPVLEVGVDMMSARVLLKFGDESEWRSFLLTKRDALALANAIKTNASVLEGDDKP